METSRLLKFDAFYESPEVKFGDPLLCLFLIESFTVDTQTIVSYTP